MQNLNPTYSTLTDLHTLNHIVGLRIYDNACIELHPQTFIQVKVLHIFAHYLVSVFQNCSFRKRYFQSCVHGSSWQISFGFYLKMANLTGFLNLLWMLNTILRIWNDKSNITVLKRKMTGIWGNHLTNAMSCF